MEYIFRNTERGRPISIRLEDYGMILSKDQKEEKISYASVLSVRISKSVDRIYKLYIVPDAHPPVVITSRSYSESGQPEDLFSGYALFVRVLHHHLREKSRAVFVAGDSPDRIWRRAGIAACASFLLASIAGYMGFNLISPYLLALVLTILLITAIYLSGATRLPRTYKPTEIPLQFLP